jgi:amidophosphoribosyltransferase
LSLQIHNGNLTNAEELRATLQRQSELSYQRHLRTDSDSEVLLNIFADEIHRAHKVQFMTYTASHLCGGLTHRRSAQEHPLAKEQQLVFEAVTATMKQLKGSYSIISLISHVRCVVCALML